jgi:hypothetical protein
MGNVENGLSEPQDLSGRKDRQIFWIFKRPVIRCSLCAHGKYKLAGAFLQKPQALSAPLDIRLVFTFAWAAMAVVAAVWLLDCDE